MKICPICNIELNILKAKKDQIYCSKVCAGKRNGAKKIKTGSNIACKQCSKTFYAYKYQEKEKSGIFCSRSCRGKFFMTTEKGKKIKELCFKNKKDFQKGHKFCGTNPGFKKKDSKTVYVKYKRIYINKKHVTLHRYLMEIHLGRKLEKSEHIHHINGNKLDNRIENLVIISQSEHSRLHALERYKK